ncbi:MAG: alkaline phosphatase family protein [Deltaproteobacteria bacterium]|nr:alkaline phosphatase family protein [Deltaproteobacteria bacterium]
MLASKQPRVLVISLAEATMDLIIPWAEAGLLPTFKSLMSEGTSGPLRSQIPLITPQVWGTIVTGKSPGYHGLFDFWQRGPDGRFREINGSDMKGKPIWQILSKNGIRSGIVNIPFTYPPQKINGFMISGEDAPGAHRSIASPSGLYDEIVRKFGRYRLKDIFVGGRQKTDYLTLIEEDVTKQTDVLEYLIS